MLDKSAFVFKRILTLVVLIRLPHLPQEAPCVKGAPKAFHCIVYSS